MLIPERSLLVANDTAHRCPRHRQRPNGLLDRPLLPEIRPPDITPIVPQNPARPQQLEETDTASEGSVLDAKSALRGSGSVALPRFHTGNRQQRTHRFEPTPPPDDHTRRVQPSQRHHPETRMSQSFLVLFLKKGLVAFYGSTAGLVGTIRQPERLSSPSEASLARSRSRAPGVLSMRYQRLTYKLAGVSIRLLIRLARVSSAKGFVSTCMPGSRWPWLRTAFSA